jgi:UDP-N-acetylglucosamine 2-epimerase
MTIYLIVGTRPQIIKSTPIMLEAIKQGLEIQMIHTGQHYDSTLSQVFFNELHPPEPLVNLQVGSGSQVYQVAETMLRLEKYLCSGKPSICIVPGDTNSALAGALACIKLGIPIAHLESGARSYDMGMAEEVNRRLIDHCATTLFAPTDRCKKNLKNEHVQGSIHLTGDTMFDIFTQFSLKASELNYSGMLGLPNQGYAVLTTHRAENVDDPTKVKKILNAIGTIEFPIVFPIHPRTKERLRKNGISIDNTNIHTIDPVGYIEMLSLLKQAKIVITDSGGLQKEAFWSKVPCVTIRDRTEWMETVDMGVNFIVDVDPRRIREALKYILDNYAEVKNRFTSNPYSVGKASEKIIGLLKNS